MSTNHETRVPSALALVVAVSAFTFGCMAHTGAATSAAAAPGPPGGNAAVGNVATEAPQFGTVNFPVSCSRPAQEEFNRAVGMLHSFFYPETVKAFNRVLELDAGCTLTAGANGQRPEVAEAKGLLARAK